MTKKFIGQIPTLADIEPDTGVVKGMKDAPHTTEQQVRQALKGLTRHDFGKETKDAKISIRLSTKDRQSMEKTAKLLGLTVADYLVQLHQVAAERLGTAPKPRP